MLDINHPSILRMFRSMTTEKVLQELPPEKAVREEVEAAEAASEVASEEEEAALEAKAEVATEVTDLDLRTENQESPENLESLESLESQESQEFTIQRDHQEEEVVTEAKTSHTERKETIKEREDHTEVETEKIDHTESLDLTTRRESVKMRPTTDLPEEVVTITDLTLLEIVTTPLI